MKKCYLSIFLFILSLSIHLPSVAQLVAGDLAFTGFSISPLNQVSLIVLKVGGLPSGTVFHLTDNGYSTVTSALTTNEGDITVTTSAVLPQFTEILVQSNSAGTGIASCTQNSSGSFSTTGISATISGAFALSSAGDQVFAVRGTLTSPTFITGMHTNNNENGLSGQPPSTAATWDKIASSSGSSGWVINGSLSAIPPTLTNGVNAVMLVTAPGVGGVEYDYAAYKCAQGSAADLASLRTKLMNVANWNLQDGTALTVPTACTYASTVLPLKLLSFTGKVVTGGVALQWVTAEEVNTAGFDIERRSGNDDFEMISRVASNATSGQYQYLDDKATSGGTYAYRLKMRDIDGQFTYSPTVSVAYAGTATNRYSVYPVPVSGGVLYMEPLTTNPGTSIHVAITDLAGHAVYKTGAGGMLLRNGRFELPVHALAKGSYVLRILDQQGGLIQVSTFRKE